MSCTEGDRLGLRKCCANEPDAAAILPGQLPTVNTNAPTSADASAQSIKYSTWRLTFLGARWMLALGLIEAALHYVPVFAIVRSGVFRSWSAADVSIMAYTVLNVIWLKFLLIWRFFRLWSLLDGVDCLENMAKCMSSNYTVTGFWQGWHCSFHAWLVRYIYVPLGGSRHGRWWQALASCVVFVFVAAWHDMNASLLTWGCLFAGVIVPEKAMYGAIGRLQSPWARRFATTLCGVVTIFLLMVANLVGFSMGTAGTSHALWALVRDPTTLGHAALIFASAIQVSL